MNDVGFPGNEEYPWAFLRVVEQNGAEFKLANDHFRMEVRVKLKGHRLMRIFF